MNKTLTFTPDSMAIIDGEVYLLSKDKVNIGDYGYSNNPNEKNPVFEVKKNMGVLIFQEAGWSGIHKILATTNTSIPNVKHIERSKFVNPDVYVEELAQKAIYEEGFHYEMEKQSFKAGFKAGYNANKKEFTREEIEIAYIAGKNHNEFDNAVDGFNVFLTNIRPLSIPKEVICDEEYNVIEIKW